MLSDSRYCHKRHLSQCFLPGSWFWVGRRSSGAQEKTLVLFLRNPRSLHFLPTRYFDSAVVAAAAVSSLLQWKQPLLQILSARECLPVPHHRFELLAAADANLAAAASFVA